ncbi:hypothetical protein [Streptomyces meridianus]|uniref:Uncharacterized protein n=1 Tax=Streptomyces meridianus TaxID=2938945 RepID=A0ABT0XCA7_9ACTN|nr:hypothetical protein [Streptomyces meridianus]MCM2580162.1 hypothetical protein [Streptomyces meridianus]
MANNPPNPAGQHDQAGSTQMFRAFVDESESFGAPAERSGSRAGLVIGIVVAAAAVVAAVAWVAMG